MTIGTRTIRAPRGPQLSCKGWPQEAALRMLMNNLDPDVAERPDDPVVHRGPAKAPREWEREGGRRRRPRPGPGGAGPAAPRSRRDAAHPVGQARGRLPHAYACAARADRERAAR